MPELPEVETVRRMLARVLAGRRVARARVSRLRLRSESLGSLPRALAGAEFLEPRRVGKFLLLGLSDGRTLLSHLGMSGRWLAPAGGPGTERLAHVHLRLEFTDGSAVAYQDPRRFGMLRVVAAGGLGADPSLARLGPDPLASPPTAGSLRVLARGSRTPVKSFLLDQSRIAGLGNIYVSEILFRAAVDPRRRAGALRPAEWGRIAAEVPLVLEEAIARMGTTFSTFRNVWNEPGEYGEQLLVYDRLGQPCRRCRAPIRRIVQAGRSTFLCPRCQRGGPRKVASRASLGS